MLLYLVRHGEVQSNSVGRYLGHGDEPLTLSGWRKVKDLGRFLAGLPVQRIYSSDLGRAVQTARTIGSRLGHPWHLITDPRWREMDFGCWEGLTLAQIWSRWPVEVDRWFSDPSYPVPGGESIMEVRERVREVLAEVLDYEDQEDKRGKKDEEGSPSLTSSRAGTRNDEWGVPGGPREGRGRPVVVVTHGGPVRVLWSDAFGWDPEKLWNVQIPPGSVTVLKWQDKRLLPVQAGCVPPVVPVAGWGPTEG